MRKGDAGLVIIVIYVDDLILTGDSDSGIAEVKGLLKKKFETIRFVACHSLEHMFCEW